MNTRNLLRELQHRIVVADGAFGTQLYEKGIPLSVCYDQLNLTKPDIIAQIHQEYIAAGAEIIETNTFGANRWKLQQHELAEKSADINRRGAEIALECAAGHDVWVAGSIGPLGRLEEKTFGDEEKEDIFREQAQSLIAGGVHLIVLETFNSLADLLIALNAVKSIQNILTIAQLVFSNSGKTIAGDDAFASFAQLKQAGADIVGANCGIGPNGLLKVLKAVVRRIDLPISVFPNAGFPERHEDRMIYQAGLEYMSEAAVELVEAGANVIGGCCGTNPPFIRAIKNAVSGLRPALKKPREEIVLLTPRLPEPVDAGPGVESRLQRVLGKKKVLSVELDPPKTLRLNTVIEGAKALKHVGADVISIAENPLAVVRLSNVALAKILQREAGVEPLVHLTGRDRNLIGMQSELMGMAVEGLYNVLAISGDPPAKGKQEKEKGVFDLRSLELIALLRKMNQGQNFYGDDLKQNANFTIGAAFNPNTRMMERQVERMRKKIEQGAQFFQTQPVYSKERVDRILEQTQEISVPIFLGILPLVSSRNAEFLHNEFPGISIPDEIRRRMREAGEHGMQAGIEIAWELIEHAYPHFGGLYIMPPFNRYRVAVELLERIKARFGNSLPEC